MTYTTIVGLCTLELHLPEIHSLKQKRGILKSLLARLRNTFNVSAAEVGYQDVWQSAAIAVVTVSGSSAHANEVIQNMITWIEANFPDLEIIGEHIEIL